MSRARVLLADGHTIFLDALTKLLEPEFEVVGAVTDGRTLVSQAPDLKPAGVVRVNGDPVAGANVVECSSDWKIAIRKTSTDAQGKFTLASVEGRKIYYLQFSALRPDINPARAPVKISPVWGKKSFDIRLHLGISTIARAVVRSSLAIWR